MPSAPRLRSDLTISRQETADGSFSIVKDSAGGRYYRFRETEQFIVEQLDGNTPLALVRERTERRFAATLSAADLQAFVQRLDRTGLLEGSARKDTKHRRLRGNLLYLRWPLLDPDALLDRLVRRLPFFFTPRFVVMSAAIMLVAAVTLLGNWGELTRDFGRLYTLSAIPLLVLVLFVVASAHEFAHGLTCKHFGGHVHEMGFLLMYFQPALYTNVSDAWLMPERRKRLWIGLAGPWFELFLWALAVLVWRLTAPDSGVHQLALAVTAVSGIKTLFNFNPLLKLDGYYLLSDYLAIPNLRKRSFAYVGNLMRRVTGSTPTGTTPPTARERRVYLAYGTVATVMSVGLLLYVTVKAGGFLLEKHEPLAFAAFAGLVSLKSRRRLRKLFRTSRPRAQNGANGNGAGATAVAEPDDETSDPTEPKSPVQPKKRKRAGVTKRRVVLWTLVASALAVLVFARVPLRIGGGFMVLPEENADVRAQTEGIIEDILVTEGPVLPHDARFQALSPNDNEGSVHRVARMPCGLPRRRPR